MACTNSNQRQAKWATAGAVLAALGICGACCLLPVALPAIGVAGSLVGALDSLARYKGLFVATTCALLAYGFYIVYWKPQQTCAAGPECAACSSSRSIRIMLWSGTALALSGIAFEYLEAWLTSQ